VIHVFRVTPRKRLKKFDPLLDEQTLNANITNFVACVQALKDVPSLKGIGAPAVRLPRVPVTRHRQQQTAYDDAFLWGAMAKAWDRVRARNDALVVGTEEELKRAEEIVGSFPSNVQGTTRAQQESREALVLDAESARKRYVNAANVEGLLPIFFNQVR
jgi:hypothetical protein